MIYQIWILCALLTSQPLLTAAQASLSAPPVSQRAQNNSPQNASGLPFPIPASLYQKWKKYGEWDYKQQSSEYRDFTLFNFGATGAAAGISKEGLSTISELSKPTQVDVEALDDTALESNFTRDIVELQKLLGMVTQDSHLIRIAPNFTWLDSNSNWPRDDAGISPSRWKEYRSLFERLSLPAGIVRNRDFPGAVFFIAHSTGLCTGGTSSGYAYSSKKLQPVVKSVTEGLRLAAQDNSKKHYSYVFKALKDDWYAFYEVDW